MERRVHQAGLYLCHKPVGPSSFSLVQAAMAKLRGAGLKTKVCHGGTLDPFAEGLLLLLVGPATKIFEHLHEAPKTYVAQVVWGVETDTGDGLGRVVSEGSAQQLTVNQLDAALAPFLGWTQQVPPPTSAKKVKGEPAYRRVHRGETVSLPPSRVYLHSARWLGHRLPSSSVLELTCRGGFYVRSLVRDLGQALGCGAHVKTLARTTIGPWRDDAPERFFAGRDVLPWWPYRLLTDAEWGMVKKESPLACEKLNAPRWRFPKGFPPPLPHALGMHQGRVVALFSNTGETLSPSAVFPKGL
ncbi:MAG: tRNA pseudouridine(55) synthase TruB [Myxococcaceae bacterium]|nr:tRNA pseudouridine(55) synthase TruB [Myxococcaceae bacterium]